MSAFVGSVFFAIVNLLAIVHFLNGVPFDGSDSLPDCATLRQTFQSKNISRPPDKPINGDKLAICRSDKSCCTQEMENQLKALAKRNYQTMLQNHVQSVQAVIVSTAIHFKVYIDEMMLKAEGKTLKIFEDWFINTTISANASVRSFYRQLDEYLSNKTELDTIANWRTSVTDQQPITSGVGGADDAASSGIHETSKLTEITSRFFTELFPLIYRFSLNSSATNNQQFHPEFTSCLQSHLDDMKPFGEPARMLEKDIAKTLESTKVLIAALNFGVDILNESNQLILADDKNDQCYQALLKMSYCPLCNAYPATVKPCPDYCQNVMQGCLVRYSADLDVPWSGYYKAMDKLILVINSGQSVICLEDLLRSLHSRIVETVMAFMSQNQIIHNKVKRSCGNVRWINSTESNDSIKQSTSQITVSAESTVTNSTDTVNKLDGIEGENFRSSLLSTKVNRFKDSVSKSTGFYGNLANVICSDESFVEKSNPNKCWNGQTIGQYTKRVMPNAVSSQMYNPEIPWSATNSTEPNIMRLVEKLRRVRQTISNLQSQLSLNPELDSFNQMGSEEGSGMGPAAASSDTYSDDEDSNSNTEFPDQGSGSGEEPPVNSNTPAPDNRGAILKKLPVPPQSDNDDTETKNPTDSNDKKTIISQNPGSTAAPSADLPFITTSMLCILMTFCYRACFLM